MKKLNDFLFYLLMALIAVIVFNGCMTSEKAVAFLKKKDLLDDTCSANFPVQEKFIKGDSVVTTDTLWGVDYQTDTLVTKDTVYITKTLPSKVITKTISRIDTVVKRDVAYENVLQDEVRKSRQEASTEKSDKEKVQAELKALKDKWRGKIGIPWWILVLVAGLVYVGSKFKILKLFNPFK